MKLAAGAQLAIAAMSPSPVLLWRLKTERISRCRRSSPLEMLARPLFRVLSVQSAVWNQSNADLAREATYVLVVQLQKLKAEKLESKTIKEEENANKKATKMRENNRRTPATPRGHSTTYF